MDNTKWNREQLEKVIRSKNDFIIIFGVQGKVCLTQKEATICLENQT